MARCVSGFFIDIGVKHKSFPDGFILGVECDGRAYHSSKSARDRDILRQEILEGLGWNIYRIWSTDWFLDPNKELKKLDKQNLNIMRNWKIALKEYIDNYYLDYLN